jgi:hypothetical protein
MSTPHDALRQVGPANRGQALVGRSRHRREQWFARRTVHAAEDRRRVLPRLLDGALERCRGGGQLALAAIAFNGLLDQAVPGNVEGRQADERFELEPHLGPTAAPSATPAALRRRAERAVRRAARERRCMRAPAW